jgi:hypothetical protein
VGFNKLSETSQLGKSPDIHIQSQLLKDPRGHLLPERGKDNLPFTFLLLGMASSEGDLLLAMRLGGIFLS